MFIKATNATTQDTHKKRAKLSQKKVSFKVKSYKTLLKKANVHYE